MIDNSYDAPTIRIDVGETVRFVNDGAVPHNAIAADGSWSTEDTFGDLLMQPGDSTELTFDTPGVYRFYCSLHATQDESGEWQGMVGTLIVGEGTDTGATTGETGAPIEPTGVTRSVPDDYPTIQSAVDAAEPGDLVLAGPGVYKEAVSVTTPGLVIRGTDRNAVILDGEFTRENGFAVTADGVAIENMTARGYTVNGFFWNGVTGYRGSYLTAIDDWVYGIYAFDSVDGLFENAYASGSWDAGFYIGQCDPCDAVITDVVAEFNGLGYSGTNSSGNIYIVNSEFRHNVAGVVPNTLDSELLPPVHDVVVAGNYIHDSGESERAPNRTAEWSGFGNGVILAGARDSVVRNNLLVNNATSGVQVVTMLDDNLWPSGGNEVRDNVVRGSGRADLALGGPVEQGTCFVGNDATTTVPWLLTVLHDCNGINLPSPWGLATSSDALGRIAQVNHGQNTVLEHGQAPDPELTFEQLPGGAGAPVLPAVDVFASLDFDPAAITTPDLPEGITFDERRPVILGIALDGGFWPVLMGALLWWLPLLAWIGGGLWALVAIWRADRSVLGKVLWTLVVAVIPVLGLVVYLAVGHRVARLRRRLGVGVGGLVVWLVITVAALVVGGIV
jgi:plastocyanin